MPPPGIHRNARAALVPEIERQKVRRPAGEPRRHRDLVARHREVHGAQVREPEVVRPSGSGWVRYCAIASSIDCILSVFSSIVAIGRPLTISTIGEALAW